MSTDHQYKDQLQKSIEILARAGTEIVTLLEAPELSSVRITVMAHINKPLMMMHGLMGTYPQQDLSSYQSDEVTERVNDSGPVTSFFGQPVNRRQPVTEDQLTPSEDEKTIFLGRRDELYGVFQGLSDDEIFKMALLPDGEMLIRSVAKKAGLPEVFYRDEPINTTFIDKVIEKMQEQEELEETTKQAELAMAASKKDDGEEDPAKPDIGFMTFSMTNPQPDPPIPAPPIVDPEPSAEKTTARGNQRGKK